MIRIAIAAILVTSTGFASAETVDFATSIDQRLDRFAGNHRGSKLVSAYNDLITAISSEIPEFNADESEDPRWRSLRALARTLAAESPRAATKHGKKTKVKGSSAGTDAKHPLPRSIAYRFGYRDIITGESNTDRKSVKAIGAGKGITLTTIPALDQITNLAHGALPDVDLAIAAIERQLDVHQEYDGFAQFLDDWRNTGPDGEESFYEALDRTAGTNEAVFFFDAMLADFVGRFTGSAGRKWSLGDRHDRLHDAFLSDRQYRGFIEATAYALALPASISFPTRLGRYDYASAANGTYSFRHQIDLLLAKHHGDASLVVDECRAFLTAEKPPSTLWEEYPITARFTRYFQEQLPYMITVVGDTDIAVATSQRLNKNLASALQDITLQKLGSP